jgi:hypothetical protein
MNPFNAFARGWGKELGDITKDELGSTGAEVSALER